MNNFSPIFIKMYQKLSQEELDNRLLNASKNGNLQMVKYLLTSSDLKLHADIMTSDGDALRMACYCGHLEVVKYLLTSTDLKKHINIHIQNDKCFKGACENNHDALINYLIIEYEIEKTLKIKKYLKRKERADLESIFNARDLSEKLNKELGSSELQVKKVKI